MEPIKIKSYAYYGFNILILIAIVCFPVTFICIVIVVLNVSESFNAFNDIILPGIILLSVALLSTIIALVLYFGCRTYDIFTDKGFVRVRKKHMLSKENGYAVIYHILWDNIENVTYFGGLISVLLLYHSTITIKLKSAYQNMYDKSRLREDADKTIDIKIPKKCLQRIERLIPLKIEHR